MDTATRLIDAGERIAILAIIFTALWGCYQWNR